MPLKNPHGSQALVSRRPCAEIDFTEFVHHLEGVDVTEDEAQALLRCLWDIAIAFVDFGWDVSAPHSICGQDDIASEKLAKYLQNEVDLKPAITNKEGITARLVPCFDEAGS